jgi:manganese/zinc/iron transport system ATP- binding protein
MIRAVTPFERLTTAPPGGDAAPALRVRNLTVAYDHTPALRDIDLDIPAGRLVAVVGPNGAGKSTLLKAAMDLVPRVSGSIAIHGRPYRQQRRAVAYVPQRESVDWDFPVSALDVAAMGLYGRIGWLRPVGRRHRALAREALDHVGIADLADRQISELSGGQQQRVFLARALVQDAALYLMDEPLAAVDAATEGAIVDILRQLRDAGRTVVAVHHDLHTVPEYFDHLVLLNVRVVADGPTAEVFTAEHLQTTYGGRLAVIDRLLPRDGRAGAGDGMVDVGGGISGPEGIGLAARQAARSESAAR